MTEPDRLVLNRHDGMDTLVIWERDDKLIVRWMVTGYTSHVPACLPCNSKRLQA